VNLGSALGYLMAQAANTASWWKPIQASAHASAVDGLFNFILYLCIFFFVLIIGAMVYFIVKYRRKGNGPERTSPIKGNHTLEIVWSVIPGILLVLIFVWGFKDWLAIAVVPANAMEVRVTGQKWNWTFTYAKEGIVSPDLVVPAGQPVKLVMTSKDVLHSFYIPDFRIKRDVIPGKYTVLWFDPAEEATHQIYCTEYCGTEHSNMLSKVKVLSSAKYEEWIANGGEEGGSSGVPLAEKGKRLYEQRGCVACHSVDGSRKVGPTWQGLFGKPHQFADGSTLASVDENYLRESILVPGAKVVAGYANVMPSYQGQLNDKQIESIIEYIKTLK
jgi:cytochrome c oxidase subunit 2